MGSATVQGALWGADSQVWSETLEACTRPLFERVLGEVGAAPGRTLLDVGCGSGLALQMAAELGADVSGLDASAGMLAVARERTPGAVLHQGDLDELPFDDDSFDAVTAFNSMQYADDPLPALRELRRVAVPGAPVVLATWAVAELCESSAVFAAFGDLLPPPPSGATGPFALSTPGVLEDLVAQAGLRPDDADVVPVEFRFDSIDAAVRAHLSAGPARRCVDLAGRGATTTALRDALASSVQTDGSSSHQNAFRYLVSYA